MNETQLTNAVFFILGFLSFAPTAYAAWVVVGKIDQLLCRTISTVDPLYLFKMNAPIENVRPKGFGVAVRNLSAAAEQVAAAFPTAAELTKNLSKNLSEPYSILDRVTGSVEATLPPESATDCLHQDTGRVMATDKPDTVLCFCINCDYEQEFKINPDGIETVEMGLSDSVQAFIDFGGVALDGEQSPEC